MSDFDYRHWARVAADWSADYREQIRDYPVRADVSPGDVLAKLPEAPPERAENFTEIFADFEQIVPGAMMHWQHPGFMAYFANNASPPAMIADILSNAISAQGMLWETSPAGTEIELRMIDWLAQALGLPAGTVGTMQDSATSATLCAVLTMRERALGWTGNKAGLSGGRTPRIYASREAHSSVDKVAWVSGIGQDNLVKVPTDVANAMRPDALRAAITADISAGLLPAGVIACAGGTSIGAFDRIGETLAVARDFDLYTHVDAAWAGNAMICPEFRGLWSGVETADSIVMNPYKWLGSQFDGAVQFLRDPGPQIRTLTLRPDYLGEPEHGAVNLSEWSVSLGRRFRALKLWFLIRAYGLEGLRAQIRAHINWAAELEAHIAGLGALEITTPRVLSLFTFRHRDGDATTGRLLAAINRDGRLFLAATIHDDQKVIRLQVGAQSTTQADIMVAKDVILNACDEVG